MGKNGSTPLASSFYLNFKLAKTLLFSYISISDMDSFVPVSSTSGQFSSRSGQIWKASEVEYFANQICPDLDQNWPDLEPSPKLELIWVKTRVLTRVMIHEFISDWSTTKIWGFWKCTQFEGVDFLALFCFQFCLSVVNLAANAYCLMAPLFVPQLRSLDFSFLHLQNFVDLIVSEVLRSIFSYHRAAEHLLICCQYEAVSPERTIFPPGRLVVFASLGE